MIIAKRYEITTEDSRDVIFKSSNLELVLARVERFKHAHPQRVYRVIETQIRELSAGEILP